MTPPNSVTALSVCVFCGSRFGTNAAHEAAARELGQVLGVNSWRLVYGAGDVGLMGTVARATQDAGGETFGVIPTHLMDREVGKQDLSSFVVTETMHERKKVMFMNCDVVVVLPGGAGSLDEFFEVLTWRQLGLHSKPIFLLNTDGYWDPLLGLMNHIVSQDFADKSVLSFVEALPDVPSLTERLNQM